jgi:DNA invertase Pin-like site-specific DNA recombinase
VLYARVSTTEQAERDLSLPAQLSAMRAFTKQRGLTIVDEYVEPGASGTDDHRKVFQKMIAAVSNATSDVSTVLVYHSSRFMRNVAAASVYKERLRHCGVRVVAIRQETTDNPSGHLLETVQQAIDQYESEVNGERTSAAMRQCAEQGYFPGGITPYGFAKELVQHGTARRALLVHDPAEAEVAREMFRLYVPGGDSSGRIRSGFVIDLGRARKRLRGAEPVTSRGSRLAASLALATALKARLEAGSTGPRSRGSRKSRGPESRSCWRCCRCPRKWSHGSAEGARTRLGCRSGGFGRFSAARRRNNFVHSRRLLRPSANPDEHAHERSNTTRRRLRAAIAFAPPGWRSPPRRVPVRRIRRRSGCAEPSRARIAIRTPRLR